MAAGTDANDHCLRQRDYLHYVSVFSVYYGNGGPKFPKKVLVSATKSKDRGN